MSNTLSALPKLAADYIRVHGWIQGLAQDETGRVCLTGALQRCAKVPGDDVLVRTVLRERNRAERWNDTLGRTEDEVLAYLDTTKITEADMEETFGPQWREVVERTRRSTIFSEDTAAHVAANAVINHWVHTQKGTES